MRKYAKRHGWGMNKKYNYEITPDECVFFIGSDISVERSRRIAREIKRLERCE